MSAIPSMSWYLADNMPEKFFNINVNVSIDTKLSTQEIRTYNIKIYMSRDILYAVCVHQ